MSRHYPLEIENVGSHTYIVMSRGHHDSQRFMKAVKEEGFGDWPLGHPQKVWVKATPCNTNEYNHFYHIVQEGVRGAFPATYSWETYGEERFDFETV